MSTTIKISLIALGLFISGLSYGGDSETFEAEVTGTKSFRLELKKSPGGAKIKLKDQSGYVLYNETISGSQEYHKVVNVSTLPEGSYQIELEYPTRIQILPLEIESGGIVLKNSELEEMFKPVVRLKGSTVSVTMLNNRMIPLNIRIYDNRNKLVFEDQLANDLVLGKQYNFSKMRHGVYTINLAFNDRLIAQNVTIE